MLVWKIAWISNNKSSDLSSQDLRKIKTIKNSIKEIIEIKAEMNRD